MNDLAHVLLALLLAGMATAAFVTIVIIALGMVIVAGGA
jgi:hypothetical protein